MGRAKKKQASELAQVIAELTTIESQLRTSTVSYCRVRLLKTIERLTRIHREATQ